MQKLTSRQVLQLGLDPTGKPVELETASPFAYYKRLNRVFEYVQQNYHEHISLSVAALRAHMSPAYFSSFFHEKTGLTFTQWLRYLRVKKAIGRIARNNTSITALAHDVGFNDIGTFERAFREVTGTTPSKFKGAIRAGHLSQSSDFEKSDDSFENGAEQKK